MLRDLDPPMDDATRRRLTRLIDAIETGPPPSPDELRAGVGRPLQIVSDNRTARPRHPRRPGRPGRTPLIVGIAAALALLVGAALVLRTDDDGTVSNDPGDVPRLVPDPATLPDGFDPGLGTDLPLSAADVDPGTTTVTLYGAAAADGGPTGADLAVIVVRDETIGMDGDPTTVRGREGRTGTTSDGNDVAIALSDDFAWISWDETEDVEVTLASRRLGPAVLATIAEDLTVEGGTVRLGELPVGIDGTPIGTLADMPFSGIPYAGGSDLGHAAYYGRLAGPTLMVATFVGDDTELTVARWMSGADQPAEVRGHEGWYTESVDAFDQPVLMLLWPEADGVIGMVQASGMTKDELVRLADGLRPATDAEWQALLDVRPDLTGAGTGG